MNILIIHHYNGEGTLVFVESRLINNQGEYVKIGQGSTQANAFQAVCPKDNEGEFIPTHVLKVG